MISCSNRYGPLGNEEGPCNTATHKRIGTCMDGSVDINSPSGLDRSLKLHVHRKLDEVKNLVLSLMNQLTRDPGLLCGCSCSQPRLDVSYPVMRGTPKIAAVSDPRSQADNQYLQPCPISTSTLPPSHTECRQAPPEVIQHKRVTNVKDWVFTRPDRPDKITPADYSKDPGWAVGSQVLRGAAIPPTHYFESPDDARHLVGMRWLASKKQAQAPGYQGGTLFMLEVPKLPLGVVETPDSLLNKVIYWLRVQRKCLSVIRADIVEVDRHCQPGSKFDFISICFVDGLLMNNLIDFELRTWYLRQSSGVGIRLKSSPPSASLPINSEDANGRKPDISRKCVLTSTENNLHLSQGID
ncbi:hypothetical protein NDU88_008730 [Pleurodeles waltl]|uniref:Uncharacterized protein n=1 Tax=Pleurodeles waltl TaxID=8319 RepID=A0AAV7RYH6_PLEWA|nr:hypothetical protein NDU88_008730 [Pleurodeles waltl]